MSNLNNGPFKPAGYLPNGCGMIAAERVRQEKEEGWTPEHDDRHAGGELSVAAHCYLECAYGQSRGSSTATGLPEDWPWESEWWKPSEDPARNLIKAGALIAAETDRLYRQFQNACNEITLRDFGFECFDEMDAYDLKFVPWVGEDPQKFVSDKFSEDYDRLKYEREQEKEGEEDGGSEE